MHCVNRDQLDYLGMLFTSNIRNIKKVYEEYVNMCDKRTFTYILRSLTIDRGMCWIDNTKNPSHVTECVFYKTITLPINWKPIGSERTRSYSEKHYTEKKKLYAFTAEQRSNTTLPTVDVDTDCEDSDNDMQMLSNIYTYNDRKGRVIVCKKI